MVPPYFVLGEQISDKVVFKTSDDAGCRVLRVYKCSSDILYNCLKKL